MGIFDGCLLACDIDGTLMSSGYINPRNIEKIEYFMQEGGNFSIATGRSVGAINDVLKAIERFSPSIVLNGGMIYDYQKNNVLYEVCLPDSDKYIVKKIIDSDFDFGIEIHCGHNVYTLKQTKETDDHQTYEGLQTLVCNFEDICNIKWNKILYSLNGKEDYEVFENLVSNEKINSKFLRTCAEVYGSMRFYYEQIPLGVSKASALEKLASLLNIKENCIFAMGDYFNDLEMLDKADISAVPSAAPQEVKSIADFVAGACEDGAVADFIDYLTCALQNKEKE